MFFQFGLFSAFFIIILLGNYIYYCLYQGQNTNYKMYFGYIIQIVLLILYFFIRPYNQFVSGLLFYLMNIIPLFFYQDTFKSKVCSFFIVLISFSGMELLVSFGFIFICHIFGYNITFLDELYQIRSFIYFVPIVISIMFDCLITFVISQSIKKNSFKIENNILYLLISIFLLVNSLNFIYVSNLSNFISVSAIYVLLSIINLLLINQNINNFSKKYKQNKQNKYFQILMNEQQENLKHIDENFQKIRKRSHDFKNHILIIYQLFETHDDNVKIYIQDYINKNNGGHIS